MQRNLKILLYITITIKNKSLNSNLFDLIESQCIFKGKICILDIDVQGVKLIKLVEDLRRPLFVFMKPPSLHILEERLRARGTETEESLQKVRPGYYINTLLF